MTKNPLTKEQDMGEEFTTASVPDKDHKSTNNAKKELSIDEAKRFLEVCVCESVCALCTALYA